MSNEAGSDILFELLLFFILNFNVFLILFSIHISAGIKGNFKLFRGIILSFMSAMFPGLIIFFMGEYRWYHDFQDLLIAILCLFLAMIFIFLSVFSSALLKRENSSD